MPIILTLADARTEVIHLAGIDGKTGANGRHSPTRMNAVINRKYRALRSRVSQLGYPHFLIPGAATPLPAKTANEDFIEIPMPAGVAEIGGVDVQIGTNARWFRLDPAPIEQRRDLGVNFSNPVYFGGYAPAPSGVGYWSILKPPVPNAATITAGTVSLFPSTLTGNYKTYSVDVWADITNDAHIFMLYEAWDEWFLNASAMTCITRDKSKRDMYEQCQQAWLAADSLVVEGAARFQRGGYFTPTPYGGINL